MVASGVAKTLSAAVVMQWLVVAAGMFGASEGPFIEASGRLIVAARRLAAERLGATMWRLGEAQEWSIRQQK